MKRRLYALPAVMFSFAVALSACSGSDDDAPESDGTTSTEDSADAEAGAGDNDDGNAETDSGDDAGQPNTDDAADDAGEPESDDADEAADDDTGEPDDNGQDGADAEQPAGNAKVPNNCSDDVMAILNDLGGDAETVNIGPDETDPDLVCSFFKGDQGSESVAVIISPEQPLDWSQMGEVESSEITVAGFDAELADLVGAGKALVVDMDSAFIAVNIAKDADVSDDDITALAEAAVQSALQ